MQLLTRKYDTNERRLNNAEPEIIGKFNIGEFYNQSVFHLIWQDDEWEGFICNKCGQIVAEKNNIYYDIIVNEGL